MVYHLKCYTCSTLTSKDLKIPFYGKLYKLSPNSISVKGNSGSMIEATLKSVAHEPPVISNTLAEQELKRKQEELPFNSMLQEP